ncbi:DUF6192 family protein [Streptomyces griseus]|uniref:DUF6192 family protein n=1 Tax=Streptomyces griseus TaxID=1911 RepID=UPI0033EE2FF5
MDRPPAVEEKVRAATDWLEAAIDSGEFFLDEQPAELLAAATPSNPEPSSTP